MATFYTQTPELICRYLQVIQQYSANVATKTFKYPIKADGLSITPVTWYGDLICMKIRLHGCAYGKNSGRYSTCRHEV